MDKNCNLNSNTHLHVIKTNRFHVVLQSMAEISHCDFQLFHSFWVNFYFRCCLLKKKQHQTLDGGWLFLQQAINKLKNFTLIDLTTADWGRSTAELFHVDLTWVQIFGHSQISLEIRHYFQFAYESWYIGRAILYVASYGTSVLNARWKFWLQRIPCNDDGD